MSAIRISIALASVALTALLSPTAAQAGPILEWLCGCSSNVSAQTTYAPAYVAPVVAAAPASCCSSIAPQTTYYAPSVVYQTPVTTYRPFLPIIPRPTTTYYVPAAYNPYSAAPVTVYRPVMPVVATTQLLPYTSYRMVYPTVTYYSPAVSYYSAPAPSTGCCAPLESYSPATSDYSSGEAAMEAPSLPPSQPSTATTYQNDKPATTPESQSAPAGDPKSSGPDIAPIPVPQSGIQPNSLPNPEPRDSRDRTTMRPVRQVSHEVASSAQPTVRILSADLWRPAND